LSFSDIFARVVALIGAATVVLRRMTQGSPEPAWGNAPAIPGAKPQGGLPTLKMPTAQGWSPGQRPIAAPGLIVNAFATGLKHPRWIEVREELPMTATGKVQRFKLREEDAAGDRPDA